MCECETQSLELLCDQTCRRATTEVFKLVCANPGPPFIAVYLNGVVLENYTAEQLEANVGNFEVFGEAGCDELDNSEKSISIIVSQVNTFFGIYDPDPYDLVGLLNPGSSELLTGRRRRRNDVVSTPTLLGPHSMSEPVSCLELGATMLWSITDTSYPRYDKQNLWNSNPTFDHGKFDELDSNQRLSDASQTLFAFRFTEPGTYAFTMEKSTEKRLYIRVMEEGAQCPDDGAFQQQTPRTVVSLGIRKESDLLTEPDWILIFSMVGGGLVLILIVSIALLLFRKYGWLKTSFKSPWYRRLARLYPFEDYSSKGSSVHPAKRYHPAMEVQAAAIEDVSEEMKGDEFWDYDQQIDLEGFCVESLHHDLFEQSRKVTGKIDEQKNEVKSLYQKVADQTESLKRLWVAKLNLQGRSELATQQDLREYETRREQLEQELERRKAVGRAYLSVVEEQTLIHEQDMACRREHQVKVNGALAQALRLLKNFMKKRDGSGSSMDEFDSNLQHIVGTRVDELLHSVNAARTKECKRLGAWSVLGQATGASLVDGKTGEVLTLEQLLGADGNVKTIDGLVRLDPVTGLLFPADEARMLGPDGRTPVRIPPNFVLHPRSGHILPIEGSIAFDPIATRLVFTSDNGSAEAGLPSEPLIPYIPYPVNPSTGVPVDTSLRTLEKRSDMHFNHPMADQASGQYVPILGVTIHPQGDTLLPVGGVHCDPITGLPVPIEVGGLMTDKQTKEVVPIVGVSIDCESGKVVPVGGVTIAHSSRHSSVEKPIVVGDQTGDPLSGRDVRVTGARFDSKGMIVPTSGGFPSLLDANELACEERVVDSIMELKTVVTSATDGRNFSAHAEEAILEEATTQLNKARTCTKKHLLMQVHNLKRRHDIAMALQETGGSPGCMEFISTGQLLPLLVGTTMQDPGGSGMEVPILGVDRHPETDSLIPLGGTMEDPEGAGLIPITLGKQAIDSVTGEQSKVCGVRINPETRTVVPVTLSSRGHRKRKILVGSENLLEDDAAARRSFWRRQKQKGLNVIEEEDNMMAVLLEPELNIDLGSVNSGLDSISDMTRQLDDSLKRETQRRADVGAEHATRLPPDVVAIMTEYDSEERDLEKTFIASHAKFTGTIRRFIQKLQAENFKYESHLKELKDAHNPEAEASVRTQHHEIVDRLRGDLKEQLTSRLSSTDLEFAVMGYVRELSDLCLQEAKEVLTGRANLAGDYDSLISGFFSHDLASEGSNRELVPLLEKLIELMESGGTGALASAIQSGTLPVLHGTTPRQPVGAKPVTRRAGVMPGTAVQQVSQGKVPVPENVETTTGVGSAPVPSLVVPTFEITETDSSTVRAEVQSPVADGLLHVDYSPRQKEAAKNLTEKHTIELVKLENELRADERSKINEVLEGVAREKLSTLEESKEALREQLRLAETDSDVEKVLVTHAQRLQSIADRLDQQKREKLESVKEQLSKNRLVKKQELQKTHAMEAETEGLGIDVVVDGALPSQSEVNEEIGMLSKEQEALLDELNRAFAEETSREGKEKQAALEAAKNRKMEEVVMAMNSSRGQTVFENFKKSTDNDKVKRDNVADKLKAKGKMRKRNRRDTITGETILGDTTVTESTVTGDVSLVTSAMLDVYSEVQQEMRESELKKALAEISDVSEEVKLTMFEKYQKEAVEIEENFAKEKGRQSDIIMARLAARRRLREEEKNEQAINEQMKKVQEVQINIAGTEARKAVEALPEIQVTAEVEEAKKKLEDEQISKQAELELRHMEEAARLDEDIKREQMATAEHVTEQMEERKLKMLEEKEKQFDRAVVETRQREEMSNDEYDRLLEAHKREVAAMEAGIEQEKEKQKKVLRDKIAEKKRKKAERLSEKQKTEVERAMSKAKEERDALVSKMLRAAEMSALSDSVRKQEEEGDASMAETVIYRVLQQRHMRETVQLSERYEREKAAVVADAKSELQDSRQSERENLVAEQEQAMIDLVAKSGSLKNMELAKKKAELKRQHKMKLREFDHQTANLLSQAEKDAMTSLEVDYAHKRLELREQQLQELASAMKELTPEQALIKSYSDEADKAAQKAREFRERAQQERQQRVEKMKEAKRKREEELKQKMEERLRQAETELAQDQEREQKRQAQFQERQERVKRQEMEAREREERQKIEAMTQLTEQEREQLLKQHEENMKKYGEMLEQGKEQARKKLQEQLAKRKEKRRQQKMKALEEKAKEEEDQERQREHDELMEMKRTEAQMVTADVARAARPRTPSVGGRGRDLAAEHSPPPAVWDAEQATGDLSGVLHGQVPVVTDGTAIQADTAPFPTSDAIAAQAEDYVQLLMKSPVFQRVCEIEEMLKTGVDGSSSVLPNSQAYIDPLDAQWICQGETVAVSVNELSPGNFVVYQFGNFVMRMLSQDEYRFPKVTLLLASNLPPNNYSKNAFRNSYRYQRKEKILFVRQERMEHVGGFILVVIHALAHIKVQDMIDDSNPPFLREFYRAMRICCQDLFFARSRSSGVTDRLEVGRGSSIIESAFTGATTTAQKRNVVEELINVKVTGPSEVNFSAESLKERLEKYKAFSAFGSLRAQLSTLSGMARGPDEFATSKLRNLTGESAPKMRRSHGSKSAIGLRGIRNQRELVERQVEDLNSKVDHLNGELTRLLRQQADLEENAVRLHQEGVGEKALERAEQQQEALTRKIDAVTKKVAEFEKEIKSKHSLLSPAK
jgi:hypothetical protein